MKLAYLVNQYPKVSHTFIRREIAAVECLGIQVERISIRPSKKEALEDRADQTERERTHAVLDGTVLSLLVQVLRFAAFRPWRFWQAAKLAFDVGKNSDRGLVRHLFYFIEACALADWVERTRCEHVHAHFGTNSATVAMLCHELGGPPFSFTVHGPEEFDKPDFIALSAKIERSAFVAAVSSFGLSQLCRSSRFADWSKLHIVRCGVDAEFFDAPRTLVPSAPRLVCVGRLAPQKGQLLLIEAAALLHREGVAFELVLVGDGEMRAEIEASIARHGLTGQIRITGWADGERVRQEIDRARALVLPSFAEGLPVVLMEALALGRPVIATYIAGIPELVAPSCGWIVPAGSVTALVAAMRDALTMSPQILDQMAEEGMRRVRALHDVRSSALTLSRLVKEVAA